MALFQPRCEEVRRITRPPGKRPAQSGLECTAKKCTASSVPSKRRPPVKHMFGQDPAEKPWIVPIEAVKQQGHGSDLGGHAYQSTSCLTGSL